LTCGADARIPQESRALLPYARCVTATERTATYRGVDPKQLADMSTLPLFKSENGTWLLIIRPSNAPKEWTLNVQNNQLLNISIRSPISTLKTANHEILKRITAFVPIYEIADHGKTYEPDAKSMPAAYIHYGVFSFVFLLLGFILSSPFVGTDMGIVLALSMGVIGFVSASIPYFIDTKASSYLPPEE